MLYDPPWLIRLYDIRLRCSDLIVELYNLLFVYINVYISYELSKYHMISCGLLLCRMYTGITKCFQFEEGALRPCGVLTQNSGILGSVLFQFPSSIPNKITSGIELGTPCATACGKDPGSVAAAGQPNANDDIPCDMGAAMAVSRIRSLCAESASNTSLYWRLLLPDV